MKPEVDTEVEQGSREDTGLGVQDMDFGPALAFPSSRSCASAPPL